MNNIEYILIPNICPICGGKTSIKNNDGIKILYCTNNKCEGKLINRIEKFFSKEGLDAKGISKATIEKLINWGWVNSISDIFKLGDHEKEWKNKTGFGEKSVSNIIGSINQSCNTNIEAIISAAGIPLIGRIVARDLAKRFKTYSSFREAISSSFNFSTIDGFGYEMNKSLKTFNYEELDYIVNNYLHIIDNIKEEKQELKLKDLIFCITGKVTIWKNRDELSRYIESMGGKVTGSVTKNTKYLINNDVNSTSAKNNKAKELGIEILSEKSFIEKFDIQK